MPLLSVFVDDETMARLQRHSAELGRSVENLAEAAVAEAALQAEPRDTWHKRIGAPEPGEGPASLLELGA